MSMQYFFVAQQRFNGVNFKLNGNGEIGLSIIGALV